MDGSLCSAELSRAFGRWRSSVDHSTAAGNLRTAP